MLDGLKPYSEYKDSSVPWLAKVPAHWEVVPLKRLAMFKSGAGFPVGEQGQRGTELPFFKVSDMNLSGNESVMVRSNNAVSRETATRLGATVFPARTIIFPKVGGALLTNKRRVVDRDSCMDNNLMGCVVSRGDPDFVLQVLRMIDLGTIAKPGPVPAISEGEVREIRGVLPPPDEQAGIVRFLGAVDRKVNRFIRAKRRLIEVLTEQKQAIITHAVTKGLNPHAPLKPSGIDWLGDVPEHWRTPRLGRTVDLITGFPFPSSGFTHNAADVPLLRGVNVAPGALRWNEVVRWPDGDPTLTPFHLRAGDVVLGMDRPVISTGVRVAVVRESDLPCLLLQRVCRLRAHEGLRQAYIPLLLIGRAFADYLAPIFTGISVPHISPEQICSFRVVLPPVEEQDRILEYVAAQTRDVDAVIDRTEREIDLIREYRTRLVADVVTGKLDVRKAAARLPDESKEREPIYPDDTPHDSDDEQDSDRSVEIGDGIVLNEGTSP